ncbi:Na+/H+ antiporter subunit E [Kocuria sp. KH4]
MSPRPKNSLLVELPLLVWLVLVWGALWGDFGVGNLLFGAVLALLVTWVLYLPPVQLSGRFNPLQFAVFAVSFVGQVAKASVDVMLVAVLVGPRTRSAVVGVDLRTRSDLLLTATGHTMALIPGSILVEVDRARSTLYFHALNVRTPEDAEAFRRSARQVEAAWIRIMGTREELTALRAERRGGDGEGHAQGDSAAISSPVTSGQQIVGGRRADVPTGTAEPGETTRSTRTTRTTEEDRP